MYIEKYFEKGDYSKDWSRDGLTTLLRYEFKKFCSFVKFKLYVVLIYFFIWVFWPIAKLFNHSRVLMMQTKKNYNLFR